ncbi:Ldh family oxidoreductase [Rhizobium sp. 32-5/1]|uniref:Ldh family oxidoreductase n=1 Tax=Rhizobium sp. 32-5/1 TaxID=3019602 RepID=UPI0032B74FEA
MISDHRVQNSQASKPVTYKQLIELIRRALLANGYSERSATILAKNCAAAQRDGSMSHGVFRLKDYASTIKSGYANGNPEPSIEDVAPGFLRVDADNGFAQIAISAATDALIDKARKNGIAILAVRNSHHLGALYLDIEDFARKGLIALAVVNSIGVVAPRMASGPCTEPIPWHSRRRGLAVNLSYSIRLPP